MRRRRRDVPPPTDEAVVEVQRQLQSLDERLARVERLLADTEIDRLAQAEQGDLIDLRLHSARLAAELSRVTVDLQARIDTLASEVGAADRPERPPVEIDHLPTPVPQPASRAWVPVTDD